MREGDGGTLTPQIGFGVHGGLPGGLAATVVQVRSWSGGDPSVPASEPGLLGLIVACPPAISQGTLRPSGNALLAGQN